jgi:hypothetical protein
MRGLTRDCLVEFVDRKSLWVFVAVAVFGVFTVLVTASIETRLEMQGLAQADLEELERALGNPVLKGCNSFIGFVVFLAVLASAALFPRMLERGRVDFYLSKPLTRSWLLLNRFFAVWLVYGAAVLAAGLVVYLAVWLVHDVLDISLIYLLLTSLVSFFIWLSITCCFGVLSGSNAMAIMAAFVIWVAQKVLAGREVIKGFLDSRIVDYSLDFFYYVVPKTSAVSDMFVALVSGRGVDDWMPLWSSLLSAAVLLYVAVWWINRRDF